MSDDRYSEWVSISFATARFEPFLPVTIQMLGRLDCHLIVEDARFAGLSMDERDQIPEALRATDRLTLSYLWVLGAYEAVRTIHQRASRTEPPLGDKMVGEIADTKKRFARLRMPLAKMEPASAHQDDSRIGYPAFHPRFGTAWQVAAELFISRRELSDALQEVLQQLRASDANLPQ
jgi:hypothetical protein